MAAGLGPLDRDDLLTVDLGNTTLDGLRTGPGEARRCRTRHEDGAALRELLSPAPRAIVICSVVEDKLRALRPV